MKWLTKISLTIGMLLCGAGLILGELNHIEFGIWGVVAFVCGIVFFGVMLAWRGILNFVCEKFDISYDKEKGLKIEECKCKK